MELLPRIYFTSKFILNNKNIKFLKSEEKVLGII